MNDNARYTILRRLDDPERWLFWTVDEAAALMGPRPARPGGHTLALGDEGLGRGAIADGGGSRESGRTDPDSAEGGIH